MRSILLQGFRYTLPGIQPSGLVLISIANEFSPLNSVIIGLGVPYQRDKEQARAEMQEFPLLPETDRKAEVSALTYPTEEILQQEYLGYVEVLEKRGIEVLRADPEAAYSFDYTCPRDIGFVIGDTFFIANMAVKSRVDEIKTIQHHIERTAAGKVIRFPDHCVIEGGDVVVLDEVTVLAGYHQRSNHQGCLYLKDFLAPLGINVVLMEHTQLHLDCCLNPLGRGHLLIHPDSLTGQNDEALRNLQEYEWIEVDDIEREHLATNILSLDPDTVLARTHPSCARVNHLLEQAGYTVETTDFDGVPATGGSFRCASLPLLRGDHHS